MGLFHYYDIEHAEVFIFDNFLIKQIREGVIISHKEAKEFKAIIERHFSNKNMAYISNRVAAFSVDLKAYKEAESISNLVAIAVIPGNESIRVNAELEKKSYNRPFGIFNNLTEAIKWVHTIIDKENKKHI